MASTGWIGKTLNERYEITELLGQGGMSAVYKANDPNLRRVVAIKLIHAHLADDREFVRRFEAEAASVAQLRHPHLIQVYDFNHDADNYYIVFEFVPGETLQDRLLRLSEAGRTLSVDEAVDIAVKIADGLHYAHKKSLVHRDIKPANIMLNVQGEPIITDFGIAKIVGGTQHTATGAVLGTAKYMSPEQIKGEQIDARTDIYALGATFFEMLAGRPPFTADSAMTLMMMHVTDPVPNVQDLRPDVPPALVNVLRKALAKNAADRYQTAEAFKQALLAAKNAPAAAAAGAAAGATIVEPSGATEVIPPPGGNFGSANLPPGGRGAAAGAGSSGPNWLVIGGAIIGLIILVVAGIALFGGNGAAEETATAVAIAAVTETAEADIAATETAAALPTETATATSTPTATATATSSPTATNTAAATATTEAEPTATPTATATTFVAPTATTAPPPTATSSAPALGARINSITLDGSTYVVNYETFGYTEALPGQHVHFYWNNITQEQAGVGPSAANWYVYGGPRPFRQATTADRPGGVTAMCVLVANPDHTAVLNTGNCVNLP